MGSSMVPNVCALDVPMMAMVTMLQSVCAGGSGAQPDVLHIIGAVRVGLTQRVPRVMLVPVPGR